MAPILRICIFLLTCLSFQANGQLSARFEMDSTSVETGNPFVLHLFVPGTKNPDSLNFSAWQDQVNPQNVISQTAWTRKGNILTCDLTLVFFDADTIVLAPLPVTYFQTDTIFSNPLSINVYPTPASDDLNDMAKIKDISREEVLWTDYLPMAASILAGLAIMALLFYWYSRSKKKQAHSRSLQQLPHELALKKLNALEKKSLWQQGAVKAQCAELTFIIREYLEKRYQVRALESTSEELMSQLKKTDFPIELKADLENILTQADLAKFAKAIPPSEFHPYSMDFTRVLINNTIPAPILGNEAPALTTNNQQTTTN